MWVRWKTKVISIPSALKHAGIYCSLINTHIIMIAGISSASAWMGNNLANRRSSFLSPATESKIGCQVSKENSEADALVMSWHADVGSLTWVTNGFLVWVRFTISSAWSLENDSLIRLSVLCSRLSSTKKAAVLLEQQGRTPSLAAAIRCLG